MRRHSISRAIAAWSVAALVMMSCTEFRAEPAVCRLEIHLVWGTNDDRSPDPSHKPVDSEVKDKLKELPLKWSNYFEVTRKTVEVTTTSASRVALSDKCELEVKSLTTSKIEVTLFGKGKETLKRSQALPKGEMLVLGGNAPNSTAWLVVLKRIE